MHNRDHQQRICTSILLVLILASLACNAPAQSAAMRPTATHWPTLSADSVAQTQAITAATPVIGPTATPQTYIVKPGDTAANIAATFEVTLEQLLFANEMQPTDLLQPGRVLTIPQGGTPPSVSGSPSDASESPTPLPTAETTAEANPLAPYSIDTLSARAYDGGQVERVKIGQVEAYIQYAITYKSDDISVTGLMNIPRTREGPFPVIVMLHGGIDQETYKPGDDTAGPADFFARNGYLTVAPDYRSYNNTEGSGTPFKLPWVIDAMSLIQALPTIPEADPAHVGVMGHSRGGWLSGYLMVLDPEIKAVSMYAPLSLDQAVVWDIYLNHFGATWPRDDAVTYGSPETNPDGFRMTSPYYYLDRVAMPVQIHHGNADSVLPVDWSRDLADQLENRGKTVEYYEYPGAEHTFIGDDYHLMLDRTLEFFDKYVK